MKTDENPEAPSPKAGFNPWGCLVCLCGGLVCGMLLAVWLTPHGDINLAHELDKQKDYAVFVVGQDPTLPGFGLPDDEVYSVTSWDYASKEDAAKNGLPQRSCYVVSLKSSDSAERVQAAIQKALEEAHRGLSEKREAGGK